MEKHILNIRAVVIYFMINIVTLTSVIIIIYLIFFFGTYIRVVKIYYNALFYWVSLQKLHSFEFSSHSNWGKLLKLNYFEGILPQLAN